MTKRNMLVSDNDLIFQNLLGPPTQWLNLTSNQIKCSIPVADPGFPTGAPTGRKKLLFAHFPMHENERNWTEGACL